MTDNENTTNLEINKCTCDEDKQDEHTCPYQEDVYRDSEFVCTCCDFCMANCSDQI